MAAKPPKATVQALVAGGVSAATAGELTEATQMQIQGPWQALANTIGISGPAHINRAQASIRALRRFGG